MTDAALKFGRSAKASHYAYTVLPARDPGQRGRFIHIGAVYQQRDGKGVEIQLDQPPSAGLSSSGPSKRTPPFWRTSNDKFQRDELAGMIVKALARSDGPREAPASLQAGRAGGDP